jgi:hypothetical protein
MMNVDIEENLRGFLSRRSPENRYASFDYCFNYFQQARESEATADLDIGEKLELSCLNLGFYLASWGMMRGSGGLYRRSLREFAPVIKIIAAEPPESWDLDVPGYSQDGITAVLQLGSRIQNAYTISASPVLVSKTMLGVFGCVPAFDRYVCSGLDGAKFNRQALTEIREFYEDQRSTLDAVRIPTLDFMTKKDTSRCYTQAKIIDMILFEEGLRREG